MHARLFPDGFGIGPVTFRLSNAFLNARRFGTGVIGVGVASSAFFSKPWGAEAKGINFFYNTTQYYIDFMGKIFNTSSGENLANNITEELQNKSFPINITALSHRPIGDWERIAWWGNYWGDSNALNAVIFSYNSINDSCPEHLQECFSLEDRIIYTISSLTKNFDFDLPTPIPLLLPLPDSSNFPTKELVIAGGSLALAVGVGTSLYFLFRKPYIPEDFICPLTKKMMKDPIILRSGDTADLSAFPNQSIKECRVNNHLKGQIVRFQEYIKKKKCNPSKKEIIALFSNEEDFICPISLERIEKAVILNDGNTYDSKSVEDYIKTCKESGKEPRCPLNRDLVITKIIPNLNMQRQLDKFKQLELLNKVEEIEGKRLLMV